jgi:hypothetical protein
MIGIRWFVLDTGWDVCCARTSLNVAEDASIPVPIVSFPSGADLELYVMPSTVPDSIRSAFGWICQGSTSRRRHSFSTSTMGKGGGKAEGRRIGRCSKCIYFKSVFKGRLDVVDDT